MIGGVLGGTDKGESLPAETEGFDAAHLRRVLYRYAASRVRDAYEAEDLVQETLLVAVTRTEISGSPQAYLLGVLKHKISDHFTQAARVVPTEGERMQQLAGAADPVDAPGAAMEKAATAELARAALTQLADRDRDVLTLRMAGATVTETAAALALSEGATRVAQSRALRRFQTVYAQLAEA